MPGYAEVYSGDSIQHFDSKPAEFMLFMVHHHVPGQLLGWVGCWLTSVGHSAHARVVAAVSIGNGKRSCPPWLAACHCVCMCDERLAGFLSLLHRALCTLLGIDNTCLRTVIVQQWFEHSGKAIACASTVAEICQAEGGGVGYSNLLCVPAALFECMGAFQFALGM